MSSSGHPSKSTLPPIDDNTELKARCEARSKSVSLTVAKTKGKRFFFFCSSSPRGPSNSPSAHSISTPEKNRFPRGTTSRSTFHGAQLRDRRSATYNGPPASPTLSHDTGALAQQRRGTSAGIISKITSKFVRRSVKKNYISESCAQKDGAVYFSVPLGGSRDVLAFHCQRDPVLVFISLKMLFYSVLCYIFSISCVFFYHYVLSLTLVVNRLDLVTNIFCN